MINYNNKKFQIIRNSENGDTSEKTTFLYQQKVNILTATYQGGSIISGHLIGLVDDQGNINMRYHHINENDEIMTGTCQSTPEILPNGKIRLIEKWQWTSGDGSRGTSIIEEV